MDEKSYPISTINTFMEENLFFKDAKLKKYFMRNEKRDLGKFRNRLHSTFKSKTFEKQIYVLITDNIRDIILDTIGEISDTMKTMGDLIISGGEAFNMYVDYKDRIITSDIDAKFVPRIQLNTIYFGRLQAVKLLLWNKLGQIAKKLNARIHKRLSALSNNKIVKYIGLGFTKKGPFVTRRYTLIKKKKGSTTNKPSTKDVFIDVELFALDLNVRCFSPEKGRIDNFIVGGILDIPFMRPKEFGYDVARTKRRGIQYRNPVTNKIIKNKNVFVASKEFLIEDIYLMQKLRLRPEKKEKDRKRLVKLGQLLDKRVKNSDTMDTVFKLVRSKLAKVKTARKQSGTVNLKRAMRVDPNRYSMYTTEPSKERLSKQIVHGMRVTPQNNKINGYERTYGNQQFNLKNYKWKPATNNAYVKNEFTHRPTNAQRIPPNLNMSETLYGFKPRRDGWVPKPLLERASKIPYIGLKR